MTGLLARLPRVKTIVEFWPAGLARSEYGAGRCWRGRGLRFSLYEVDEVELCVRRADPRGLLERFPATSENFASLLCVKTPLVRSS